MMIPISEGPNPSDFMWREIKFHRDAVPERYFESFECLVIWLLSHKQGYYILIHRFVCKKELLDY